MKLIESSIRTIKHSEATNIQNNDQNCAKISPQVRRIGPEIRSACDFSNCKKSRLMTSVRAWNGAMFASLLLALITPTIAQPPNYSNRFYTINPAVQVQTPPRPSQFTSPFRPNIPQPYIPYDNHDSYNIYMAKNAVVRRANAAGLFPREMMLSQGQKRSFLNGKKRSVEPSNEYYSEYEPIKAWNEKRSFLNG